MTASLQHYQAWFSSHTDIEVKSNANPGLRAMARDAVRFVLTFRAVIEIAPLQVYCSALIFSPRRSTVREHFWHHVPDWIEETLVVPEDWDSTLQVLNAHSDFVEDVRFSPDGKLLASGSKDGTVRLWDPTTGTCRSTLEGHSSYVTSVAFSPDGKLLASGAYDNTVRLWDPATGTGRSTLEGHSSDVTSVAFSADGKLLASGSDDNTVRLWDPATGTCRSTLEGHSDWVRSVAFSPDGKLLASGSDDRTVRLWDPATGTCRSSLEGHSFWVTSVAFLPGGKLLRSTDYRGGVLLWDVEKGKVFEDVEARNAPSLSVSTGHDLEANPGLAEAASGTLEESRLATTSSFPLLVSEGWILLGERKLLLLPPNRGGVFCFERSGSIIAIGHRSGALSIVGFNVNKIP